jgi:peptidoglycan/xylan/chitin deacetylase (PgdA/CDA1 family)
VLPDRLVVVAYHDVPDAPRFAEHLDFYVKTFQVVDVERVAAASAGQGDLPSRPLLITFDDGDRTVYDNALPALVARRLPAVAFVVTDLLDTDQPYWWAEVEELVAAAGIGDEPAVVIRQLKQTTNAERVATVEQLRERAGRLGTPHPQLTSEQVREMSDASVTIGNHTATHPLLDQCEDDELENEIGSSHQRLTELLGSPPRTFAYPNGNTDPRVPAILCRLGYTTGFVFDHRRAKRRPVDQLAISRVRVDASAPIHEVRAITSGLHPLLHATRSAASR